MLGTGQKWGVGDGKETGYRRHDSGFSEFHPPLIDFPEEWLQIGKRCRTGLLVNVPCKFRTFANRLANWQQKSEGGDVLIRCSSTSPVRYYE
jgi:hypothetical protein